MNGHDADERFWATVREQVQDECVAYGPGELAAFAEGKLPPAHARTIEAHLAICGACRSIVEELRRELAATQAVYRLVARRPAASDAWKWALAPVALAAAAFIVILTTNRPTTPLSPTPQPVVKSPTIAQIPSPAVQRPAAVTAAPSQKPVLERRVVKAASGSRKPRHRKLGVPAQHRRPTEEEPQSLPYLEQGPMIGPEQALAETPPEINIMPMVLSFAERHPEAIFDVQSHVNPVAHPELVNDLQAAERNLLPKDVPGEEKLFAGPENELPNPREAAPSEGEMLR